MSHIDQVSNSKRPFADLTGRTAVVTGGSSGIGAAIAEELAAAGAHLIIQCRRSIEAAQRVADSCRRFGGRAHVLTADLGQPEERQQFVEQSWKAESGIDVWINNAGVDLLTGPEAQLPYEAKLTRLLDVDVQGTVHLAREAGRRMQQGPGGVILNIGWDQADRGMEGDSGELFATAKNAIMGFTRSLAVSLAPKVRVNCIAPGWIRTAWGEKAGAAWQERVLRETPLKRWGTPEDIARLARFLVSRDAEYITGQVINANGGAER
jgi:3-oxoacyl-[acyl-carrier protein] reductase